MPTAGDMLPNGPGWIMRELAAIRRAITELRAARRLERASIGAGGLTIDSGGYLAVQTPAGTQTVYVGALGAELNHTNGSTQQGVWLRREDGTLALAIYADPTVGGDDRQGVSLWDRTGRIVVADDIVGGGLARPWIPAAGWYDITGTEVPVSTTTSGSFTAVVEQQLYQQHPKVRVVMRVRCSDGTTGGEVRVMSGATQVGATQTIAVGTYAQYEIAGTAPIVPGGWGILQIQARRTAGSGSIGVRGLTTWGAQT
ncbi:hypothetical protein [Embleya sp. NPDC005971]|uniref:hypothetical protein n=1 Tax=Embleya sp. NPDC005971 TaxID=3156724 RepID=UPI0033D8D3DC